MNQSPFNVGTRLTLEDFTSGQVADLNQRYGSPLQTKRELSRFFRLVNGHPYLVRRGLHELVTHAALLLDSDGVIRQNDPGTDQLPSLAWRAAEVIGAPVKRAPGNRFQERWLNYYGPPDTFVHVGFFEVLDGVPAGFFRDKVVYVGARPAGLLGQIDEVDEFRTPFTRLVKTLSPGVEIQATAFLNLVRQDWLTRPAPAIQTGVLLLAGLTLGYCLPLFRPAHATLLAVAAALLVVGLSFLYFWQLRIWFP